MRRLLPFLAVLILFADDARASCAPPNPREQVQYADAVFDGRFESERREGHQRRLTFRVDRVLKGQLGETVEIHEPGISTISFGSFAPGERVGLMINFAEGTWRGNECLRYDPEELADAVKPIPRPPGRGTAALVVGGRFGDATGVVFDRRGRTLAYRFAPASVVSVCPGGRRLVALGDRKLLIERTRDFRTIRTQRIQPAHGAHCLGRTVVIATSTGLLRGGRRSIWRGEWTAVAFRGRFAHLASGHRIVRVDLRSGRARTVAVLPLAPEHDLVRDLELSPDGRHLAVLAPNHAVKPGEPPTRLAVVDLATRQVRTTDLASPGLDGALAWDGNERFAFLPAPSFFRGPQLSQTTLYFGRDLEPQGQIAGWTAGGPIAFGSAVVGVVGHRLERATPAGTSELGRLPSSGWGPEIVPLGGGVRIDASRRIPKY